MIKNPLLIFFAILSQLVTAQKETCESPVEDPIMDLNSITKCSIEESDKNSNKRTKTFTVQVSSRRRVARKKKAVSSTVNEIKSNEIAEIEDKRSIVNSLSFNNEKVVEKMPFNHVEEIPLFKSCQKVPLLKQKKCFTKEINKHIVNNFKYPEEAYRNSIQGRVLVQFVIDKEGYVSDFNIRTPYKGELLEKEAKRIISTLPRLTPGKHQGKLVKVKYGVPISFKIPGKEPSNVKKPSKNIELNEVFNFTNVDKIPAFKTCNSSNGSQEDCFNQSFVDHINNNFSYPLAAVENNIEGKVIAYFVIDSNGEVVNIKTRAPEGKEILEKATKELIEKLPKFIPGKHNGKKTNVSHAFPVVFKLEGEPTNP